MTNKLLGFGLLSVSAFFSALNPFAEGDTPAPLPLPEVQVAQAEYRPDPPKISEESASVPTLNGPKNVQTGKSAVVRLNKKFLGSDTTCNWIVLPDTTNAISGENQQEVFVILLDLDPGRYFVSLGGTKNQAHAAHMIEVSGDVPPPGPPGPPNPPPGPPTPPPGPVKPDFSWEKFGLASGAYAWVDKVPAASRSKAKDLANNFESVSSAIGAGGISTPAAALAETLKMNTESLGATRDSWIPWATELDRALKALNATGKLSTMQAYQEAWIEISKGLLEVK